MKQKEQQNELTFTEEPGKDIGHTLTVYALSTCGFCKRALEYLRKHNIAFRYIYVDKLSQGIKSKLKQDLKSQYNTNLLFPFLVIDEKRVLTGFVKKQWAEALNLS